MKRFILGWLGVFSLATAISHGALIREEGALYLEDVLEKPLKSRLIGEPAIYSDIKFQQSLGTLRPNQDVVILAVSDTAYRVKGNARQGQVSGWVNPKSVTPLDEKFLKQLRESIERTIQVNEFIARNEVAINMTTDEVAQSLGKPDKKQCARIPRETTGFGNMSVMSVCPNRCLGGINTENSSARQCMSRNP